MPIETKDAILWALTQSANNGYYDYPVTLETNSDLVDKVREYFNMNNIDYLTFSYDDLKPFFQLI